MPSNRCWGVAKTTNPFTPTSTKHKIKNNGHRSQLPPYRASHDGDIPGRHRWDGQEPTTTRVLNTLRTHPGNLCVALGRLGRHRDRAHQNVANASLVGPALSPLLSNRGRVGRSAETRRQNNPALVVVCHCAAAVPVAPEGMLLVSFVVVVVVVSCRLLSRVLPDLSSLSS